MANICEQRVTWTKAVTNEVKQRTNLSKEVTGNTVWSA